MQDITKDILICPKNDPESVLILLIAEAFHIPTLQSLQRHGGTLEEEPNLISRLKEISEGADTVTIVELPGVETEQALKEAGYRIQIIDHHSYKGLNRLQEKSSLEQFLEVFDIQEEELKEKGFDPVLVEGVGAIDRGFLWELQKTSFSEEEKKGILTYYQKLQRSLGGERRRREEAVAKAAWQQRIETKNYLLIRTQDSFTSIRDALSFLVFESYPERPPQTIIVQGSRRMYVQESVHAKGLHERYGGFLFGQGLCWGIVSEEEPLPKLQDIINFIS